MVTLLQDGVNVGTFADEVEAQKTAEGIMKEKVLSKEARPHFRIVEEAANDISSKPSKRKSS